MEAESNALQKVNIVNNKKKQAFGFGIFTSVVLIVLLAGAIAPSIKTITTILSEISEKEVLLDSLTDKLEGLTKLGLDYDEIEDQVRDLELLFPNNGDFSLFLANAEQVVVNNGFELVNISFDIIDSDPVDTDTRLLSFVRVSLSVEGNRDQLILLLKELEELPVYPIIETVSFSTEEDENGNTKISVQLLIYKIEDINFYD